MRNGDLSDKCREAVKGLAKNLEPGERIMVSTHEVCPCNSGQEVEALVPMQTKCHLCNGRGWIIDCFTFRGDTGG